jgi:hypothetical protein
MPVACVEKLDFSKKKKTPKPTTLCNEKSTREDAILPPSEVLSSIAIFSLIILI